MEFTNLHSGAIPAGSAPARRGGGGDGGGGGGKEFLMPDGNVLAPGASVEMDDSYYTGNSKWKAWLDSMLFSQHIEFDTPPDGYIVLDHKLVLEEEAEKESVASFSWEFPLLFEDDSTATSRLIFWADEDFNQRISVGDAAVFIYVSDQASGRQPVNLEDVRIQNMPDDGDGSIHAISETIYLAFKADGDDGVDVQITQTAGGTFYLVALHPLTGRLIVSGPIVLPAA